MKLEASISTAVAAREFIASCVATFGMGFHPDTRGLSYINLQTHDRVFNPVDCALFDQRMEECFGVLEDPYAVAIEFLERL